MVDPRTLKFLLERIRAVASRPEMWGGPDSVEEQLLQLFDVLTMLVHPETTPAELERVQARHRARIACWGGGPTIACAMNADVDERPALQKAYHDELIAWAESEIDHITG